MCGKKEECVRKLVTRDQSGTSKLHVRGEGAGPADLRAALAGALLHMEPGCRGLCTGRCIRRVGMVP